MSAIEQIFPAIVTNNYMLPLLDSQIITLGKFILCWTGERGKEITKQTICDLLTLNLYRFSLYVECFLPLFGLLIDSSPSHFHLP